MSIKTLANTVLKRHRYNGSKKNYENLYKRIITSNQFDFSKAKKGETEWLEKWRKYDKGLSPLSYRVFSKYIGEDINIMPLEIQKGIVEPILTPELYSESYSDKNIFDHLFYGITMPKTIVRNINGVWYDKDYSPITHPLAFMEDNDKPDKIVLKPSKEAGGRGVVLFARSGNKYVDSEGNSLTIDYLNEHYKQDCLIQEAVAQSLYLAQFNPTSVNTLRIVTYRSVRDGKIHVINAIMRIGAKGKCVDNAHSGGLFVGIDKDTGNVGKYVCDYLGRTKEVFNDIDFNKNYSIPNWGFVREFAKMVSKRITQHVLVAMDIALDEENNPVLIEINVSGFSGWLFQFTTSSVFGEFTDEIMEYCYKKYQDLDSTIVLK